MDYIQKIIAYLLSLIFTVSTLIPFYPAQKVDMDKFELVWSDEFEGEALDSEKWTGHHFTQGKTVVRKGGYWNLDFAKVVDGNLRISTKYFEDGYNGNGKPGWYSSALNTKGLFEQAHGYFEIRCILPKGSGLWSAFWLGCDGISSVGDGGRDGAEIDIYESPYYSQLIKNRVTTNIHYDGYGEDIRSQNVSTPFIIGNNPYEEYNTYSLEWNEDEYIFYINGKETGRSDFGGTSLVEEYLILSVEVGGSNGVAADSWAGSAPDKNVDVSDFIVDYVRVYQYK